MAVAFRSDNEVTNGTAGTSVTVTKPSGLVDTGDDRDHLFAVIAAAGAPSITPPADWNLVDTVASGSAVTLWTYEKLPSAEGASWTWTLGSSLRNWGWVGAYTGVDHDSPVYEFGETSTLDASLSLTSGEEVQPAAMYFMAAAATRTASGVATTWAVTDPFDGLTPSERADVSTNAGAGTDISGVVADASWAEIYEQSLVATATASQTQTAGVAHFVSIRPYFVPYTGDVNDTGLVVEFAFDVDPDSDSSEWTYTDVTSFAHEPAKVTMRHGRGNRASVADPSELRLTLLNLDGEFTHPAGTYGLKLVENLPIRVRLNGFGTAVGANGYHRGTFFLASASPRWDASTNFAVVDIVANGRLRRLQQGDEPVHSAAYTAIQRMASNTGFVAPVAHWPCEDEADSAFVASAVPAAAAAVVSDVTFAADSEVVGAAPLMKLSASSWFNSIVPTYTPTGTWTAMFVATVPAEPAAETGLLAWRTNGTAAVWRVSIAPGSPSAVHLRVYSATAQILDTSFSVTEADYYTFPHFYTVTATQNGTGIDYSIFALRANEDFDDTSGGGQTGTLASNTYGNVNSFTFSPQPGLADVTMGHIALHVQPGADGSLTATAVLNGNKGEWPWARFNRLCEEQDVPYFSRPSENTDLGMGPQSIASVMQLVRECETVEGCVLNDSGTNAAETGVLWFPARDERDNIDATLTLDVSLGQVAPGFQPILDDQDTVNDQEVSRAGGSSARVTDPDSIARKGRKNQQVTVNTEDDRFLADLAGWRVNLGTVEGYRFPSVTWNLRRSPELAETWVNMALFERLDIINPPSQYAPDDIRTILEGYTETISSDTWTVTANLSPWEPNHVMVLAETVGDVGTFTGRRVEDLPCALRTAVDSDDTAIVFDPNRTRFTTTADDYPLNIRMGGEVITTSSCATTAGTFVAVGVASHANNAAVSPALYAGATAGDLICVVAAIRSSGTGTLTTPTGYTRLEVFAAADNVQVYVKVHSGSESAPTVTPSGGSAGDTVSGVTFGLRGTSTTLEDLNDLVVTAATPLLNSSAADIAYAGVYPRYQDGCILLLVAWKQDDYTSVAVPSGWTELVEASTTTGNDQSLYIAYQIQTTPALANGGSLVVTGGASAISRATTFALAAGYQTFTASARSVNGVTKSHTVGTLIAVDDPGVLGM